MRVHLVVAILAVLSPLLLFASFYDHLLGGFLEQGCRLEGLSEKDCVRSQVVTRRANTIGLAGLMCGAASITTAIVATRLARRRAARSNAARE